MIPTTAPRFAATVFTMAVGAAMLVGTGVASAEPADSSPSASSDASSESSDRPSTTGDSEESDAAEPDPGNQDAHPNVDEADGDADPSGEDTPETDETEDVADDGAVDPADPVTDVPPVAEPESEPDAATDHSDDPAASPADKESETAGAAVEPVTEVVVEPESATPDTEPQLVPEAPVTQPDAATQTVTTTPDTAQVELRKPTSFQVAMDNLAFTFARILGYTPDTPGGLPTWRTFIEQVFAGWRRVLFAGSENEAPTAKPVQLHQFQTGEIIGDLAAYDHNGDRLTYRVVQGPAGGRVILNANGTYGYIPDPDFAKVGGTDTFAVEINDNRTLPGLTTVQVTVNVAPTLGRSRGYDLDNLSTHDVTIYLITLDSKDYHGPGVGHIIKAATNMRFEVTEYFMSRTDVAIWMKTGTGIEYIAHPVVPAQTDSDKPSISCAASGGECAAGGQYAQLLDYTATITKDATIDTDAQAAADILFKYCADGRLAQCSFKTKSQDDKALGAKLQLGRALVNRTTKDQTTKITEADTRSETDTLGISAKLSGGGLAKLASIINLEFTASYSHSWTRTHSFSQDISVTVPPQMIGIIYTVEPVYRVKGDFTVKLGNTTYHLNNVTFETPRTDGRAPGGAYEVEYEPLTLAGIAALPPGTQITLLGDPEEPAGKE